MVASFSCNHRRVAVDVMQGQLRDQLPGGWSVLQGPYPEGYPVVFHPGMPTEASGQLPIFPGRREREGGQLVEVAPSRAALSPGEQDRQREGPQPEHARRPCRVPDPVPEQCEGERGGQHGRELVASGAMSRQQSPHINPWSAEKIKQSMNQRSWGDC